MHEPAANEREERGLWRSVAAIVISGVALGVGYNQIGLVAPNDWGIAWVGRDRVAELPDLEALAAARPPANPATAPRPKLAPDAGRPADDGNDPTVEIPEIDHPIEVQLAAFKRLYDSGRILVIDARDPDEFRSGHIAGSMNLPYEAVLSDPSRIGSLEIDGRPIVTYCGGGTCEVSLNLAEELIFAGHRRVLVYMGGFPEWTAAGYAVERGDG